MAALPAPDAILQGVQLAHRHARAAPPRASDSFLIWSGGCGTDSNSVTQADKKRVVGGITRAGPRSNRLPGEHEAITVFSAQQLHRPTVDAFKYIEEDIPRRPSPLPSGYSAIDHLTAFILTAPDCHDLHPHFQRFRDNRLPPPESNVTELTIGEATPAQWQEVLDWLAAKKSNRSHPFTWIAADTESVQVRMDNVSWGTSYSALIQDINYAGMMSAGTYDMKVAVPNVSAAGLPVRFFFGDPDQSFHIRLPIDHSDATTLVLRLDVPFPKELIAVFAALPSCIGVNITADFVDWAQILRAVWLDRSFERVARPVELEDLARLARINTTAGSIFQLHWWIFGGILPKVHASIGDHQWAKRFKDLPPGLQRYTGGDCSHVSAAATILSSFIFLDTFPDLTLLKEVSGLSSVGLLCWYQEKLLRTHLAGRVIIKTGEQGAWTGTSGKKNWQLKTSVEAMVSELSLPSRHDLFPIWEPIDWPSITCGGPVSLHQARHECIRRLPALHKIDELQFPMPHQEKFIFWRWGNSEESCSTPIRDPVDSLGLIAGPGMETRLPLDPNNWNRQVFKAVTKGETRTDRMAILEFMRTHPDRALAVHTFSIENPSAFRSLVARKRILVTIYDVRNMLRWLGVDYTVPSPDPYTLDNAHDTKADKGDSHIARLREDFAKQRAILDMKIAVADRSLAMIRNPASLPGLSRREITYRAVSTAQIEISRLTRSNPKRNKKRNIGETQPPPDPPSKLPTSKSPIFKPRRQDSPNLDDAFMDELDCLVNPHNYDVQSEDEDYSYSRRIVPQPDSGHWAEVPTDLYRPVVSDVSEPTSPLQFTSTFTATHTVQFSSQSNLIPTSLRWRSTVEQCPPDQLEGPMWDPTCLASPACEETRSIYRLSTPPTSVVDEPMPSPQKPSPVKERLQTVAEEEVEIVREVIVNKPPSRTDIIARAMRQSKSSPVTITLNSSESSPAKSPPASSPPKVPIAPLALQPGDGRPGRFTQSMRQIVERAFAAKPTDLIGVYGRATLTGKSIATMRDGEELDDNILNSYYHLIEERSKRPGYPSILREDIYFYVGLTNRRDGWAPQYSSDMFLCDYVFFPIGTESHWMLVYASIATRKLYYLDSLLSERRAREVLGNIKAYMYNASVKLHGKDNAWVFDTEIVRNLPQQTNGIDCGVFTCQFAEHVARGGNIIFTQAEIPQIRRNMVWELMTRCLIWRRSPIFYTDRRPPSHP